VSAFSATWNDAPSVLILQHQEDAPAGLLLDVLHARGLQWQVARIDLGEPLPSPDTVALVVSLGSDEAADDIDLPWLIRELSWLREANATGTPILGLCFGAQALAVALGGGVRPARTPELGWIEVQSSDPSLIARGPWQGWHYDTIELPAGAELLAQNSSGPQAFRHGPHLGVQFHPEVTPQIVRTWASKHASGPHGRIDPAVHAPGRDFERATVNAYALFDAYLTTLSLSSHIPHEQVINR
jgi:GMP synthase-like glutamine amidotransferase